MNAKGGAALHYRVTPGGRLQGRLRVPGDKSVSHRAVMLGSLAAGETAVSNFLEGEDTRATAAAFRAMGVRIEADGSGGLRIEGRGLHGLSAPAAPLDLGNSGTGLRLLAGVMAGQSFASRLVGDVSLNARPMRRIIDPLRAMGASIEGASGDTPPLAITGGAALRGLTYAMPVASAQVKSCLLLAGLYARGRVEVVEPDVCRDHTERMLQAFGYPVARDGASVSLVGGGLLNAAPIEVPCDISSAAFFLVGASIAPGSDLVLENVGVNPTRAGVIEILRLMGADLTVTGERMAGGEPVADLRIRHAPLHGIEIPGHLVANAIDEFPALFVAAACARGTTRLSGAAELRVKESDRLGVMADGLRALGVRAQPQADGMIIEGGGEATDGSAARGRSGTGPTRGDRAGCLSGGTVDSGGDHRVAMAFAMAGLAARAPVLIRDCVNVRTSFPGFDKLALGAGLQIEQVESVAT